MVGLTWETDHPRWHLWITVYNSESRTCSLSPGHLIFVRGHGHLRWKWILYVERVNVGCTLSHIRRRAPPSDQKAKKIISIATILLLHSCYSTVVERCPLAHRSHCSHNKPLHSSSGSRSACVPSISASYLASLQLQCSASPGSHGIRIPYSYSRLHAMPWLSPSVAPCPLISLESTRWKPLSRLCCLHVWTLSLAHTVTHSYQSTGELISQLAPVLESGVRIAW